MNNLDFSRVLIVEDDKDLLEIIIFEFEDLGYEVRGVSNVAEAIAALESFPAFLIFSDINMSTKDGFKLLQRVTSFTCNRPYIIVCSEFDEYENEVLIRRGVNRFISKPFTFNHLERVVEELTVNNKLGIAA